MLIATVMLLALFLASGLLIIAGYRLAAVQARAAADSVAMSAALAAKAGGDGCDVAPQVAKANGVRLLKCSQVGDELDLVVSVQVEIDVPIVVRGLPDSMQAVAHAGSLSTVGDP